MLDASYLDLRYFTLLVVSHPNTLSIHLSQRFRSGLLDFPRFFDFFNQPFEPFSPSIPFFFHQIAVLHLCNVADDSPLYTVDVGANRWPNEGIPEGFVCVIGELSYVRAIFVFLKLLTEMLF